MAQPGPAVRPGRPLGPGQRGLGPRAVDPRAGSRGVGGRRHRRRRRSEAAAGGGATAAAGAVAARGRGAAGRGRTIAGAVGGLGTVAPGTRLSPRRPGVSAIGGGGNRVAGGALGRGVARAGGGPVASGRRWRHVRGRPGHGRRDARAFAGAQRRRGPRGAAAAGLDHAGGRTPLVGGAVHRGGSCGSGGSGPCRRSRSALHPPGGVGPGPGPSGSCLARGGAGHAGAPGSAAGADRWHRTGRGSRGVRPLVGTVGCRAIACAACAPASGSRDPAVAHRLRGREAHPGPLRAAGR